MPTEGELLLSADHVSRRERDQITLDDFGLNMRRGDVVALLGLNGAGKSTALKILSGVLVPDQGTVTVAGHSMAAHPLRARAAIGYLPDQPPLFDDMRVAHYLGFCARLRRVPRGRVAARVDTLLRQCELESVRDRRVAQLSKGYRQRIGLAQALVHEPAVVLLDEPSNGLDPEQMRQMRKTIQALATTSAVLFSTHLLSEAQALCNRVLVLHEGRLLTDQAMSDNDEQLQQLFSGLVTGQTLDQQGKASGTRAVHASSNSAYPVIKPHNAAGSST